MIDPRAKQFLEQHGTGPIVQVDGGQTRAARAAEDAQLQAYREKGYIERAGAFAETLIAFFVQQKQKSNYTDDECAGGVALLAINLREAYGRPQTPKEVEEWTPAHSAEKLREFDSICEAMQEYFDANGES